MRKNLFTALILSLFLVGCQTEGDIDFDIENENENGVRPVETFDLIDIRYEFLPGDSFTVVPVVLSYRQISNNSDTTKQVTFSDNKIITNRSSFSKPDKDVIINTNGRFVKIPRIVDRKVDTSVTVSSEWTFGGTEYRNQTFKGESTLLLPPQTTVAHEVTAIEYRVNITYIATIRGRITGRVTEVTGSWKGVVVYEVQVRLYYPDGRSELRSFSI